MASPSGACHGGGSPDAGGIQRAVGSVEDTDRHDKETIVSLPQDSPHPFDRPVDPGDRPHDRPVTAEAGTRPRPPGPTRDHAPAPGRRLRARPSRRAVQSAAGSSSPRARGGKQDRRLARSVTAGLVGHRSPLRAGACPARPGLPGTEADGERRAGPTPWPPPDATPTTRAVTAIRPVSGLSRCGRVTPESVVPASATIASCRTPPPHRAIGHPTNRLLAVIDDPKDAAAAMSELAHERDRGAGHGAAARRGGCRPG